MDFRKAIPGLLLLIALCWWLYPKRELAQTADRANVVEINYVGPGGSQAAAIISVMREFELESERAHAQNPAKPIYRVISAQIASQDMTADPTRLLVSVAGGAPPDVIRFDRYAVAEWAARGAFTPLDHFIARDRAAGHPDTPRADQYYKAAWNEAMYAGKIYGIPNTIDNRALVYNKDPLRRAKLVDKQGNPVPPGTWSQLLDYNRKLTIIERKSDHKQMTLESYFKSIKPSDTTNWKPRLNIDDYKIINVGFIPFYGNAFLYMFGWCNGGEFVDVNDPTRITLNDPRNVEALEFAKQIYDELGGYEYIQGYQSGFQGGALDPFISGQMAMKLDGFWALNLLGQYGRDLDFGVAPPPVSDRLFKEGHDKVSWTGGWAYAIPATAKNKAAAWELIRFLSSDRAWKIMIEQSVETAAAEGKIYFPGQLAKIEINEWQYEKFIYSNPSIPAKYVVGLRGYNDLLDYSRYRPITPVGQLLWNEHMSKSDRALYNRASAKSALDEGNAVVQRALDRYIKPIPGKPINSWTWFLVAYGSLIVVFIVLIFKWDTSVSFRSKLGRIFGLSRFQREAVVAGANGSFMRRQWIGGWICASPWIIGFIIFGGGPMLFSFIISFCRYDIINTAQFIGLENYREMFTQDPLILKSLRNTLFMVIGVPLGMSLSLALAMLLNQGIRWLAMWRTLFYLPSIVPFVATTLLWAWLLNPQAGLINYVLQFPIEAINYVWHGQLGFNALQLPGWLQSEDWSKPSLILMGLWSAGGGMIIWLAGLKGIPQSYYEAAAVDGASIFQQFRHITLPQLTPYIFFNLVMGLIATFQLFGEAFILTGGGPADSTLFYVYHLFNNAFRYGNMGYASAMAWLLFVIVLLITLFQIRFSRRWVHYED